MCFFCCAGCGCEEECGEWDGGRLLAECNSICAQLTMDSKGEGAAFRETLKFREMVDIEDVRTGWSSVALLFAGLTELFAWGNTCILVLLSFG